jgi:fatty-acyl-CoA synthase
MEPTPTHNVLPLRKADFATLAEALDYAAEGVTGFNFYSGSGRLASTLPYARLRADARTLARRLRSLDLPRGATVALVADTHPDFLRFFFACQYAGLVPVPIPASLHLGGHSTFVGQMQRLIENCGAAAAMAPEVYAGLLSEATEGLALRVCGTRGAFEALPAAAGRLDPLRCHELAYIQYTSGSTQFPRGVMISQQAVMTNLALIVGEGLKVRPGDRAMSWLPFYHDMGLVGMVLAPVASQFSVDYLSPRDFAMRPRTWLKLISENRATVSFSPTFGYELCAQRLRPEDIGPLALDSWRVAGVGAETIRPEPLLRFAAALAGAGFDPAAFMAGYGMAECSLAVSFSPLGQGLEQDAVDPQLLAEDRKALTIAGSGPARQAHPKCFVNCGGALPGFEFEVRDECGAVLPERRVGRLFVRGKSLMRGYLNDPEATREVLAPDGWLDTGDLAYCTAAGIFITGRQKDLIIVNGRNIWPQDLEALAESQPGVRTGDSSAFSISGSNGADQAVLVIQTGTLAGVAAADLAACVRGLIRRELGIDCRIELVPRHTLPRTTSGKLSRSRARQEYLERRAAEAGTAEEFDEAESSRAVG